MKVNKNGKNGWATKLLSAISIKNQKHSNADPKIQRPDPKDEKIDMNNDKPISLTLEKYEEIKNNKMPGIKGSSAVVLISRLEEQGLKFSTTREIDDGYQWDGACQNLNCYLSANKKFEISSLEIISNTKPKIYNVINCCLCVNYTASNSQKLENYFCEKNNLRVTVGDAIFERM